MIYADRRRLGDGSLRQPGSFMPAGRWLGDGALRTGQPGGRGASGSTGVIATA
jgi:hypothetical protein